MLDITQWPYASTSKAISGVCLEKRCSLSYGGGCFNNLNGSPLPGCKHVSFTKHPTLIYSRQHQNPLWQTGPDGGEKDNGIFFLFALETKQLRERISC